MADEAHRMSVSARFGRRPARGVLLGFSGPRLGAIGLAGALAVAGLVVGNLVGLLATAVVWAPVAAAAFVRLEGRPAAEWAATWASFTGRRASGQDRYRARIPLRPRPAGSLALPGDVNGQQDLHAHGQFPSQSADSGIPRGRTADFLTMN
jgi:hypothetical protein